MDLINKDVYYGRVTALKLTQENNKEQLESRYFSQIEMTTIDRETYEEEKIWIIIKIDDEVKFFLDELSALKFAMEYRDRNGKKYL